ncbi:hypothetical protein VPH5P1C_0263 [Vibrio phage 5P1c]|nr:hypothetical protein VP495E541_P0268 [Vibrio phage 495E54-1]CAH9014932.1 hypothetical protein VP496E541_P0260 [Vibrio phage 496E54-1]
MQPITRIRCILLADGIFSSFRYRHVSNIHKNFYHAETCRCQTAGLTFSYIRLIFNI